jgi:predicted porin
MRKSWVAAAVALSAGPAFAGDVKFSGKVFADASYRQNEDQGTDKKSPETGIGVDVKRFYLGAEYDANDVWSAKIVTDIGDKGAKRYDVFVKNAYIEAKLHPLFVLRLGEAGLPWVPYSEDRYGFRYVENTLIDRVGFGTSTDWGLHLLGDWNKRITYQISAVNGRGYGDPTRSKNPTGEARIGFAPFEGFNFGVGGQFGKLGQDVEGSKAKNTAKRFDAAASYDTGRFRLGLEYFLGKDDTADIVTGKAPDDTAQGFSATGSVGLFDATTVFARYDHVQPNKDTNPDLQENYLNVGVQYKPVDAVNLALVYKRDMVASGDGGTISTTNGAIGSTVPDEHGTYYEIGLFSQFVF